MIDLAAALAVLKRIKSPLAVAKGTTREREKNHSINDRPRASHVPAIRQWIDLADVLERAAILEFEGGHSRTDAGRLALAEYGLASWDEIAPPEKKGATA